MNLTMHRAVLSCYPLLHPMRRAVPALELALAMRHYERSAPMNMRAENGEVGFTNAPVKVGDYLSDGMGGTTRVVATREFWYSREL